jgi:protocatechuate 3,4-dioxygenase beta subunit
MSVREVTHMKTLVYMLTLLCCSAGAVATPTVITGTVTDDAGRPIAGADVWAPGPGGEPVAAKSAQDGTFRLGVESDPQTGWVVLATAPGLATAIVHGASGSAGRVELKLGPEAPVHGRLLDEEGRPVAGADIRLCFASGPSPIHYQTDPEGRFTLGHVARDGEARMRVEGAGFLTWTSDQTRARAIGGMVQEYVIYLVPPSTIEGTVARDGTPVAGVQVYALETPPARSQDPPAASDRATTDANGRYRLARLRPGVYTVSILEAGGLVALARENVWVALRQQVRGIDFALAEAGAIEGRCIDEETGEGVPGATVAGYGPARPRGGSEPFTTETDQDGWYHLPAPAGENTVEYIGRAPDYPYLRRPVYAPPGKLQRCDVLVPEGGVVVAPDIPLRGEEPIRVVVVDQGGVPAADVAVLPSVPYGASPVMTDAEGGCILRGIPRAEPGERKALRGTTIEEGPDGFPLPEHVLLIAYDAQRHLAGKTTLPPEPTTEPATIRLEASATITFRFVDGDGRPVAGLGFSTCVAVPEGLSPLVPLPGLVGTSGADGVLRVDALANLPPSSHPMGFSLHRVLDRLVVFLDREWGAIKLLPGEVRDFGDVRVDPRARPLTGTVRLADGSPAPNVAVQRSGQRDDRGGGARTNDQGRFWLGEVLVARRTSLLASSEDGRLWGGVEVPPNWDAKPEIVLAEPAGLTARLLDPDSKPAAGRDVSALGRFSGRGLPRMKRASTDAEGCVTMEPLVNGLEYRLIVRTPGEPGAGNSVTCALFTPEPGKDLDLGDVVVKPLERRGGGDP